MGLKRKMQQLTTPKVAKETFEAMNGGLATPGVAKWAEYGFEADMEVYEEVL